VVLGFAMISFVSIELCEAENLAKVTVLRFVAALLLP